MVDDVAPVQPAVSPNAAPGIVRTIGRMHPAAVHLPIGGVLLSLLFAALAFRRPESAARQCTAVALGFTIAAAIPTEVSGFLRAAELTAASPASELLAEHRNLMLAMTAACALAFAAAIATRHRTDRRSRLIVLALIAVCAVIATIGGHHGGQLVFGEGYLPF